MSLRPPEPGFRTARAVVFATVCVSLATAGHVLASGTVIPVWAVLTGFVAVLGVTHLLAGHERSLATILGGLLGGQFALHVLFTSATDPVHPPLATLQDPALRAAALHQAGMHDTAVPDAATAGSDFLLPVAHLTGGATMTLAHTVAALIAAWWLRRGERAAWSLARRVAGAADRSIRLVCLLLLAFLATEPATAPPRITPAAPATAALMAIGRTLRHQVVRRGPPPRSRVLARTLPSC
ncbi:hypothetical protein E1264_20755 [Actinomadura sp. KC216]|uniref:hypothetical protein n=1 Tax=Actinomadura sp. KC216 TaxID=2530370 RepID=UPI00104DB543|nr:hypothetical protein [Actinomadura sp. KC216]TDB85565.1 hypothetical protein E1264_20755 [Actinomadura sp. KC216]